MQKSTSTPIRVRPFSLFLWLILLSTQLFCQTYFSGRIVNSLGQGVPDVDVKLVNNELSTLTNSTGHFRFKHDPSSSIISIDATTAPSTPIQFDGKNIYFKVNQQKYSLKGRLITPSIHSSKNVNDVIHKSTTKNLKQNQRQAPREDSLITIRNDNLEIYTFGFDKTMAVDTYEENLTDVYLIDPEGADPESFEIEFTWDLLNQYAYYRENVPPSPPTTMDAQEMYDNMDEPYTAYYNTEWANLIRNNLLNRTAAFGAQVDSMSQGYQISYIHSESPADKAGLMVGDFITTINNISLSGMSMSEVGTLLEGEEGETKQIGYLRSLVTATVSVVYIIKTYPSLYYYYTPVDSLPYVSIESFKEKSDEFLSTGGLLKEALDFFKNEEHIILDLRSNGGGTLNTTLEMIGEFVPLNTPALNTSTFSYQASGTGSHIDDIMYTTQEGIYADKQYYILMDSQSASASELFISALIDNRPDMKFIGATTYGKARGQYIILTPKAGLARFTTLTLTPIKSEDYNLIGITPEIEIDSSLQDAYQVAAELIFNSISLTQVTNTAPKASRTKNQFKLGTPISRKRSDYFPMLIVNKIPKPKTK